MTNSQDPSTAGLVEPIQPPGDVTSSATCETLATTQSSGAEPIASTATNAMPQAHRAAEPTTFPRGSWPLRLADWQTPLGLLLAILVLGGLYLRLRDFGYPPQLQFDEHHFVETARGYLKHQSDWNDHPPLGKLLIAVGMLTIGDHPAGFRFPGLLAGLLTMILGAWTAQRMFAQRWAFALAAALFSADGFLIAYSRAALLDGFLTLGSVAALLLSTFELSLLWGCVAGLVLGFSASIKFSGIGVLLPLLFAVAVSQKTRPPKAGILAAAGLVAACVYFSSYSIGLAITNKPHAVADVISDTQRLLKHHAVLTDMKNPATSGWVSWALPVRPLLLGIWEKQGSIRALTTLGNLATWWSSILLAMLSTGVVLRLGWTRVLDSSQREQQAESVTAFVIAHGRQVLTLLLGSLGFLAPWVMSHRDSYIYHFLPAYAPLVLLLAGFLAWYETIRPVRVFGFVVVTLLVAAVFAPLWGYLPITRDAFELRLFIQSWR